MKNRILNAFVILFLFTGVSCKKDPVACFDVLVDGSSIGYYSMYDFTVMVPITFAVCDPNVEYAKWDFGDGTTTTTKKGESPIVEHIFLQPGSYNVKMTAYMGESSDVVTKQVIITGATLTSKMDVTMTGSGTFELNFTNVTATSSGGYMTIQTETNSSGQYFRFQIPEPVTTGTYYVSYQTIEYSNGTNFYYSAYPGCSTSGWIDIDVNNSQEVEGTFYGRVDRSGCYGYTIDSGTFTALK